MNLYDYLLRKGYDEDTISKTIMLWEQDLPLPSRKLEKLCYEWWNETWSIEKVRLKRGKKGQKIVECTKNKTN